MASQKYTLANTCVVGTQAAVKVLHTYLADRDAESFLSEARIIARLEHPHIVRVLDFDVQEGTAFLIMSYAPQGTLRQRHPKGSQLQLPTIIDYVKQLTDALQYAHTEKIIHCDIKPENMLLGRHGEVLLSDFGIALIAQSSRLQNTQDILGTVQYMAPEQLQGKPRLASDQYALGVVVYEWLCGDRPFYGTFTELYSQQLFTPPPSLREKVPTIPPEVEQVVLTALEKDPHKRFASVRAFATALEQACPASVTRPLAPLRDLPRQEKQLSSSTDGDKQIASKQLLPTIDAAIPPSQLSQSTNAITSSDQSLQSIDTANQATFKSGKTMPHAEVPDLSQIATTPESNSLETSHTTNVSGKGGPQKTPHQLPYEEDATHIISEERTQDGLPLASVTAILSPTPPSRSRRNIFVLVGVALFLVMSSLGLFTLRSSSHTPGNSSAALNIANGHRTATAQAQSFATATTLAQANAVATDSARAEATSVAQANEQATAQAQATVTSQAQATATSQAQVIPSPTPTPQAQVIPSPTPTPQAQAIPCHVPASIPNVNIVIRNGKSAFSTNVVCCKAHGLNTNQPCFTVTNTTDKDQQLIFKGKVLATITSGGVANISVSNAGVGFVVLHANPQAVLTVIAS